MRSPHSGPRLRRFLFGALAAALTLPLVACSSPFVEWLMPPAPVASEAGEAWVIVVFEGTSYMPSDIMDQLLQTEIDADEALQAASAGWIDGNEIGDGSYDLYFNGADSEQMWQILEPIFSAAPVQWTRVELRNGLEDAQARVIVAEPVRPTLDELVLTENSLGDVVLGDDPATLDPETSIVALTPWKCDDDTSGESWMPTLSDDQSDLSYAYGVRVEEGVITGVTVLSSRITTDRDIRLGATLDEVIAAYPEGAIVVENELRTKYVVPTTQGAMFFDFEVGRDLYSLGSTAYAPEELVDFWLHGPYPHCM